MVLGCGETRCCQPSHSWHLVARSHVGLSVCWWLPLVAASYDPLLSSSALTTGSHQEPEELYGSMISLTELVVVVN